MKFMLLMLPTVPGTLEDRKRLRPIGRSNERYQQMLEELRKLVVFADEGLPSVVDDWRPPDGFECKCGKISEPPRMSQSRPTIRSIALFIADPADSGH
jgi:hypothetical protein